MNPAFPQVQKLKQELEKIGVENVQITAISADDWERWQDNSGNAVFTTEHQEIQDHIDAEAAAFNKSHLVDSDQDFQAKPNVEIQPVSEASELSDEISSELGLIGTEAFFEEIE